MALRLRQKVDAEHSRAQEDGRRWKVIWKMNVPPKIKTFIWRACSNILPTRDNLPPTEKTGGPWMLASNTNNNQKLVLTLYGNVLSLQMFGHWWRGKCRNTAMKSRNSFICSVWWQKSWLLKGGTRTMGSCVLGNLECKKQVLFWENSSTAKGNPGRGFGSFGDISVFQPLKRALRPCVFFFFFAWNCYLLLCSCIYWDMHSLMQVLVCIRVFFTSIKFLSSISKKKKNAI